MRHPALLAFLLLVPAAQADVRLPRVFGDHMVLQRDRPVRVWGWCAPGEAVEVELAGQRHAATGDEAGRFELALEPLAAGGPHRLVVRGANELVLEDVLVGEVWLASGQSNMAWPLSRSAGAEEAIAAADHPRLRLFLVPRTMADEPAQDVEASWTACTPVTAQGFSAVAYHFGRELLTELDVPVGIVQSAWGGTRVEAWTRRGAFEESEELAYLAQNPHGHKNQNRPGVLYDGMIHPLIPFAIRGAIWYQGEANVGLAWRYRRLFPLMIECWRRDWGGDDFPFYFVQLAPFRYKGKGEGEGEGEGEGAAAAELREAQAMALDLPNTGMAVTTDVGNPTDIHPRNKREVGRRLALWALAKDYGRADLVYSGPLYRGMVVDGAALRVRFRHAAGLGTRDGAPPSHLELAGADRVFHPAAGRIEGEELVVTSDAVPAPVAVRYAWSSDAEPNLTNAAGLPAAPFRSDDWPGVTTGKK